MKLEHLNFNEAKYLYERNRYNLQIIKYYAKKDKLYKSENNIWYKYENGKYYYKNEYWNKWFIDGELNK